MDQPDERGGIFLAPASAPEQEDQPTADGSEEAMRRLRHPFEVQRATGADPRTEADTS
jgi:hypothetical protein